MPTPLFENTVSKKELNNLIMMYTKENLSLRAIERKTGYSRQTLAKSFERLGVKNSNGNHYRKYFF